MLCVIETTITNNGTCASSIWIVNASQAQGRLWVTLRHSQTRLWVGLLAGKDYGSPFASPPPLHKSTVGLCGAFANIHSRWYLFQSDTPQKGKLLLSQIIMLVIDDMKKCKKASATKPPDAMREQVHFFFIARLLLMHTPTPLQISNTTAAVVIISWSYQKGKRKPFQCGARCKLTLTYELLMSTLPSSKW